jgi:hypothetical protein
MIVDELEQHLAAIGYTPEKTTGTAGLEFVVIRGVKIAGGSHAGTTCDVAIPRTTENPWVPQAQVHVRPHLVAMGSQTASQPSQLGADWQYLSRRFDRPPTPKGFFAHILTVLGET